MKKTGLIFIMAAMVSTLAAQPKISLFAFEQKSMPGARASRIKDENGNTIKKDAAKMNYFIFLSFMKAGVVPLQVSIKEKIFSIAKINTRKSPVEYTDNTIPGKPEKIVLVPKSKNKVIQLVLSSNPVQGKKSSLLRNVQGSPDVIIVYSFNHKKYVISASKLKKLEPLASE